MTTAEAIMLVAFVIMALTPTIAAFAIGSGRMLLGFVAAGAWLILGIYNYEASGTPASGIWDIYFAMFWLSSFMSVVCVLMAAILREKKDTETEILDYLPEDKELVEHIESEEKDKAMFDRVFRRSKGKKKRMSTFARTGRIK